MCIRDRPYPGGPLVDKYAKEGNPDRFSFPHPKVDELNFSFSGLKTSILYFLQKELKSNPEFITQNIKDICAGVQKTIVDILMEKLLKAVEETNIKQIAIAGGVSANSGLRAALQSLTKKDIKVFIPKFEYCTDNAAMIAITGYYSYLENHDFSKNSIPNARMKL